MRRWLLIVLLCGCMAEPPRLADYVMWPSEAPADCMPTDPDGPGGAALDAKGWNQNPGMMHNDAFATNDIEPEDNVVALFDCSDGSGITSSALWFSDFGASREWAEATVRCDGELAFKDGRLVGVISFAAPTPERLAAGNVTLQRILSQGEAIDLCPERGTDARDPRRV